MGNKNKKKKKKQQNIEFQEAVKSDANLAGTPEGEKLVKEIQNPFKTNILTSWASAIVGVLMIIFPFYLNISPEDPAMVFCYLGIFLLFGAVVYLICFYRKLKAFREFQNSGDYDIVWTYTDEEYKKFVEDVSSLIRKPSPKQTIVMFICIIVLESVMFYITPSESRWVILLSLVLLTLLTAVMMFVAPRYMLDNVDKKPYVTVIGHNQAIILGTYINWKFAQAQVLRLPDRFHSEQLMFKIDYDGYHFGSKSVLEWMALLPNNSKETIDEALREARRITSFAKARAEYEDQSGDPVDRFFKKITGREVKDFEYNEKKS